MRANNEWPGAYIVGAPKCGTTAMAQYLAEHPHVCVSWPKEPHYLAPDLRGLWKCDSDETYFASFAKAQAAVRLDASIWYLYSDDAIASILARRPDARFVVMLRNPVQMVPSLHRQLVNALEEDVIDLESAWGLSEARADGHAIPERCLAPKTLIYTRTAAFGSQLARLLDLVERSQVLVLFQEEFRADAGGTYRRVLDFLGVADDGRADFALVNEARSFRFRSVQNLVKRDTPLLQSLGAPIRRTLGLRSLGFRQVLAALNDAPVRSRPTSPTMEAEIAEHYREDMHLLASILGRDLASELRWPLRPAQVA